MRFSVLGPVEVYDESRRIDFPGGKPRLVLAALLARANQVLSVGLLIDVVWGETPPASARSLIHTYVAALRRALERPGTDEVIVTRPPGYLACVGPDDLDSMVFESRLRTARQQARAGDVGPAVATYRSAEALWHGAAFGDCSSSLVATEATRLDELRLAAIEERIDAEMELGVDENLASELASLVTAYPARERLRARHMVVLYRLSRRADALATFQKGRTALVSQFGIEPGPDLVRVHGAILRDEPGLLRDQAPHRPAREVPAQLPAVPVDFVGREEQIAVLTRLLRPAEPGPTICVVVGRGGVGKSTLALRVAHDVASAYPDGQLYADLRGSRDEPAAPTDVLGRFLGALGVGAGMLPRSADERAEQLRTMLAARQTLLILDDARDEHQVVPLLPGGRGNAVLVTARRRLAGLAGAQHVALGRLAPGEALALLERVASGHRIDADRASAREIVRLCGYLPSAVRAAGSRLASRPYRTLRQAAGRLTDDGRRLGELEVVGDQLRADLRQACDALDDQSRVALQRLAEFGRVDVPADVLATIVGRGVDAEDVAERLADAHLIDVVLPDDGGPTRYRIDELVRAFLCEQASGL